jgi:hypothetical protein
MGWKWPLGVGVRERLQLYDFGFACADFRSAPKSAHELARAPAETAYQLTHLSEPCS